MRVGKECVCSLSLGARTGVVSDGSSINIIMPVGAWR